MLEGVGGYMFSENVSKHLHLVENGIHAPPRRISNICALAYWLELEDVGRLDRARMLEIVRSIGFGSEYSRDIFNIARPC